MGFTCTAWPSCRWSGGTASGSTTTSCPSSRGRAVMRSPPRRRRRSLRAVACASAVDSLVRDAGFSASDLSWRANAKSARRPQHSAVTSPDSNKVACHPLADRRANPRGDANSALEASFPPRQGRLEALFARQIHEAFLVGRAGGFDGVVDVERLVQRGAHALRFVGPVQRFLGVAYQVGINDGDMPGDPERGGEVLARLDDAADDAEGEGALGVHSVVAGQDDVLRRLRADHPWQEEGDDTGAELELGFAEGRVARAYGDIAGERHLER